MDGLDDTLWSERMSDCHTSTTSGGGNSWTDWRTEAGSWSWLVLTGEGANDPTSSLVHHDPHLLLAGGGLLTGRARHLAQTRLGLCDPQCTLRDASLLSSLDELYTGPLPRHLLQLRQSLGVGFLLTDREIQYITEGQDREQVALLVIEVDLL